MSDQFTEAKLEEARKQAEALQQTGLSEEQAAAYWRTNITVIGSLLAVWALVSYVFGYLLAQPLVGVSIGALPFGFWWAQQGAIVVFVLLILIYALIMDRVDRQYGVNE